MYEKYFNETISSADGSSVLFSLPRFGMPPTLTEEITTEIKLILNNLRISGCSISRKVVISVGNGVLASKCTEKMANKWWKHYVIYQMGS